LRDGVALDANLMLDWGVYPGEDTTIFEPKRLALILILAGLIGLDGCGRFRPSPETESDVVQESGAVIFRGYRVTFTVGATPDQISEAFRTEAGLKRVGIFQSVKILNNREDITQAGTKIRVKAKVKRILVPMTLATIKSGREPGDYQLWLASTDPVVEVQRWRIRPRPEGSEVTFSISSEELRSFAGRGINWQDAAEIIIPVFDRMLAQVQAYFDPGFDVKAALGKGWRGERVDSIYQGHTLESRIAVPPAGVFDYLRREDSFITLLGEGRLAEECRGNLEAAACPLTIRMAGRDIVVNRIVAGYAVNRQITYVLVWSDYLALVQLKIRPEDQGRASRVKASFAIELPGPAAALTVDLLSSLTTVPERLNQVMARMKQDLETGPSPGALGRKSG